MWVLCLAIDFSLWFTRSQDPGLSSKIHENHENANFFTFFALVQSPNDLFILFSDRSHRDASIGVSLMSVAPLCLDFYMNM